MQAARTMRREVKYGSHSTQVLARWWLHPFLFPFPLARIVPVIRVNRYYIVSNQARIRFPWNQIFAGDKAYFLLPCMYCLPLPLYPFVAGLARLRHRGRLALGLWIQIVICMSGWSPSASGCFVGYRQGWPVWYGTVQYTISL